MAALAGGATGDAAAALNPEPAATRDGAVERRTRPRHVELQPLSLDAWLAKGGNLSEAKANEANVVRLPPVAARTPLPDGLEAAWEEGDASEIRRLDITEAGGGYAADVTAAAEARVLPKLNLAGTAGRMRPGQAAPTRRGEGFEGGGAADGSFSSDDERAQPAPRRKQGWGAVIEGRRVFFARQVDQTKADLICFAQHVSGFHQKLRAGEVETFTAALNEAMQQQHPCYKYEVPAPSQSTGATCIARAQLAQRRFGSHAHATCCAGASDGSAVPPLTPPPERTGGLDGTHTMYSLTGDFELVLPRYRCHTCDKEILPRAEYVGCFEVQMQPPNGQRIYWVDTRLLEEQKYLSLRSLSFSGASPHVAARAALPAPCLTS